MKQCHNFRRFPHQIFIYAVLKTANKSLLNALQASQSEDKELFLIRKRNMFDLFSDISLKKTFKSAFRVNFELSHHQVGQGSCSEPGRPQDWSAPISLQLPGKACTPRQVCRWLLAVTVPPVCLVLWLCACSVRDFLSFMAFWTKFSIPIKHRPASWLLLLFVEVVIRCLPVTTSAVQNCKCTKAPL